MTLDEMAALHGASFVLPRPWTATEFAEVLASPLSFALLRPAGFLIGRVVADEAEVLTVAVEAAARRRGVGADLLEEFVAEARARGAARAFLEVAEDNAAAIGLYGRAGFAATGRRKGYYRGGGRVVDALIMARDLGGIGRLPDRALGESPAREMGMLPSKEMGESPILRAAPRKT